MAPTDCAHQLGQRCKSVAPALSRGTASRLIICGVQRRLAVLIVAVACCAGCVVSPWSAEWRQKSDALLAAQESAAEQAKAAGGKKVILAAFALHSESTAFQGDIVLARNALRSINAQLPAFMLSNQLEHFSIEYPFATKRNVKGVLASVARRADKDSVVVLLFTSHGSPFELAIKTGYGEYKESLAATELQDYLEALKPVPTIIVISACYSGSFVPALSAENRIIMTSAARDRSSFGCSPESDGTYFVQALFPKDLDPSASLWTMFSRARAQVAEREKSKKLKPSQPQLFIGKGMERSLSIPLRELLARE